MKLEAKFNKWLVGAVMGKEYVWEHEHLVEEYHQKEEVVISTKKEASSLKSFLQ
ncbi:MAG: hypothetical protein LBG59_01185 [Candidatus Peribacteria bacterium]|jgi:hypothetical protein|nr:hypothetical protein [Candidatus Peribacteria bacterium]